MTNQREYSGDTARAIDEEIEKILREQEDRARELLTRHRRGLELVADPLIEKETIDGSEVIRLVKNNAREPELVLGPLMQRLAASSRAGP